MKNLFKRSFSMLLAAVLIAGQLALPVAAEDGVSVPVIEVPVDGLKDIPSAPGGGMEQMEVDIDVSYDANGDLTASATVEGGTTPSGSTVNASSTIGTQSNGNGTYTVTSENTTYNVASADGNYTAEGGKTIETEKVEATGQDSVTVDLVDKNGNFTSNSAGGQTASTTNPTNSGGNLKSENSANYDQTTVINTDRKVGVEISDSVVTSGNPEFVDENGNPLPNTDNGYNYFGGVAATGTGYSVAVYTMFQDENGDEVREDLIGDEITEWQTKNETSGKLVDGLYCVDASTSSKPYGYYRLANLEDAVEEGYYTVEEAKHLRAIVANGYTWDSVNNSDNVGAVNQMLYSAGILNEADGEELDSAQAAAITQTAIWIYANRIPVDSKDMLFEFSSASGLSAEQNALMVKACNYLTSLSMDAPADETQIINEEKFIDDMSFTVGALAEGEAANQDTDTNNDVYNTTLKFSMVVTPGIGDNLIVKVMDAQGNVVKRARIAGDGSADKGFGYAKTETDENGKLYYILDDMKLSENSNTTFNLKLEGYQVLHEGVYVFEAQDMNREQMVDAMRKSLGDATADYYNSMSDEDLENNGLLHSQNYITTIGGNADVDVSLQIDMTFNVMESTVTTIHEWREEDDPRPPYWDPAPINDEFGGGGGGGVPMMLALEIEDEPVPMGFDPEDAEDLIILDEEVPLAAAPGTGDASLIWAAMAVMSMGGYTFLGKKKEEDEA